MLYLNIISFKCTFNVCQCVRNCLDCFNVFNIVYIHTGTSSIYSMYYKSVFFSPARLPEKVKEHVTQVHSVNTSGIPSTNEGADFKLEMANKQVLSWALKVPSGKDWQTICSNYGALCLYRTREGGMTQIQSINI